MLVVEVESDAGVVTLVLVVVGTFAAGIGGGVVAVVAVLLVVEVYAGPRVVAFVVVVVAVAVVPLRLSIHKSFSMTSPWV